MVLGVDGLPAEQPTRFQAPAQRGVFAREADGLLLERFDSLNLRSEVNSELNFPPNFEGLVLGCIDADFCK